MNFKAKIIDGFHKVIGSGLTKLGLEIHYKEKNSFWIHLPLSGAFNDVYQRFNVKNTSLVDVSRMHSLYQMLSYSIKLEGDVAQLGVYKGGSTAVLASLVEKTGKTYHAFDTYEGLPVSKEKDNINGYKDSGKPELADTSLESVKKYLQEYSCIKYYKGYFPGTASAMKSGKFCFVYLDGDLYQSTKDGLELFFPLLSTGGVIVVDDYGSRRWAGVATAVQEFLSKEKHASIIEIASMQAVIIKTS